MKPLINSIKYVYLQFKIDIIDCRLYDLKENHRLL